MPVATRAAASVPATNPGGRPATLESLFRAEIQEEGMGRFVKKLAYVVESWDPDTEPDLPPRVAWLIDRMWPKPKALTVSTPVRSWVDIVRDSAAEVDAALSAGERTAKLGG